MHGYGIVQRIHAAAEDLLKVEDGSLYPALYRMKEPGLMKLQKELKYLARRRDKLSEIVERRSGRSSRAWQVSVPA
jgi:DNA-binding PadR family transcriptional regulator